MRRWEGKRKVILIHSAVWFHHAHWASMLQLLLDHLFRLSGTTNQVTWSSAHLSLLFSLEKLGPISCGVLGFLDVPRKLCCCLIWLNQMSGVWGVMLLLCFNIFVWHIWFLTLGEDRPTKGKVHVLGWCWLHCRRDVGWRWVFISWAGMYPC